MSLKKRISKHFGPVPKATSNSGGEGGAVSSVNGQTGDVYVTKSSVGLGAVNNTSDMNKPISTAQQEALNVLQTSVEGKQPKGDYALASDIPSKLPNPFTLSINGELYDGSKAVEIEIQGGPGGGIEEAPADGRLYARQNNAWVAITQISSDMITTADGRIYKTSDNLNFILKG